MARIQPVLTPAELALVDRELSATNRLRRFGLGAYL